MGCQLHAGNIMWYKMFLWLCVWFCIGLCELVTWSVCLPIYISVYLVVCMVVSSSPPESTQLQSCSTGLQSSVASVFCLATASLNYGDRTIAYPNYPCCYDEWSWWWPESGSSPTHTGSVSVTGQTDRSQDIRENEGIFNSGSSLKEEIWLNSIQGMKSTVYFLITSLSPRPLELGLDFGTIVDSCQTERTRKTTSNFRSGLNYAKDHRLRVQSVS